MQEQTLLYLNKVKEKGLNVWAMIGLYKKRSKLRVEIPEEVIIAVCQEYLHRSGTIRSDFPYFLSVLEKMSQRYFSQQEIKEHNKIKKEPTAFKDILKHITEGQ